MAQARLTANIESYDFGQIEWNKPIVVDYIITNTGDQPLILSNVTTSCACSVASWPQDAIDPNQKGVVRVAFDAKALGSFYKEVSIYSNANPDMVFLNFTGEVVREITDFSRSHPVKIGDIRLNLDSLNFGDVKVGDKPSFKISVVNEGSSPYAPILMHAPSFFTVKSSDLYIPKGEKGEIEVTFDSELWPTYGLYASDVYLSRFIGDKVGVDNKIPFSFTLLPNSGNNTESSNVNKPRMELNRTNSDLSVILAHKDKASGSVMITNKGMGDLKILKLQTFSPAVKLSLNKTTLKSGETARIKIKVDQNKIISKKDSLDFLIVTNDPFAPKSLIQIK